MNYEEYETTIRTILSKPDTALTEITPVLQELKTDLETYESTKAEVENLNNRVRDLQDTNIKLFLSQGGGTKSEDKEKTDDLDENVDNFFTQLTEDL